MLISKDRWRCVAAVFLLASTWTTACKANDDPEQDENYKQRREVEGQLFRAGLHRFGDQLRAQAIAAACDKKEIVDSIGPSPEDVASFLVREMAREGVWNDRRRAFLHGITIDETVELALAVSDTLLVGYRSGYLDAAKAVKLDLAVCGAGLKMDDGIPKQSAR